MTSLIGDGARMAPVPKKGAVQVATDQLGRAIDDLRLVAKERLHDPLLSDFRGWMNRVKATAERRHRVVHGVWTPVADADGRHRCTGYLRQSPITASPPADHVSPDEVEQLAADLLVLRHELVPLLRRLRTAIPEMRAASGRPFPHELNAGIG